MAENFVVSALKYRPQTFDTVVGQSHITTTLINAIKTDHLAHSFLFCGPRGVGKTTCARILAKTINCSSRQENGEACDNCDNCLTYKNNTSFNVHELDAASNNSVDDIRELTEQVRFAPLAGSKYKVYIIDEVHMLSNQAFNAFLKTLEEPPSYAIFILATTEKHKILPTILSRCQIFDFKRITTKDTVEHLQKICATENIEAEADALHFIATKSEGCMRDSLSIMDKIVSFGNGKITNENTIENLNILDYDYFFKMTDAIATQNLSSAMLMYDDILAKGFEGDTFMNGLADHLRNLMMCKDANIVRLMDVADGIKKRYFDQAHAIHPALIINGLSILNSTELNYPFAKNKRLHVEIALVKLCHLIQAIEIVSDENGDVAKKKLINNQVTALFKKVKASIQIDEQLIAVKKILEVPKTNIEASVAKPTNNIIIPNTSSNQNADNNYGVNLNIFDSVKLQAQQAIERKAAEQKIEITEDALLSNWHNCINQIAVGKEFFAKAMHNCQLSFKNECITIVAVDTMAVEFIASKKTEIIQFFMRAFLNNNIQVVFEKNIIDNQDNTTAIRKNADKLSDLINDYPLVKRFIEQLDLEIEF